MTAPPYVRLARTDSGGGGFVVLLITETGMDRLALMDAQRLAGELMEAVHTGMIREEIIIEADTLAEVNGRGDGDPHADLQPGQRCPDCGRAVQAADPLR